MSDSRRQSARYLSRRLAAAHGVLVNPRATDAQRRGARCQLNRALTIARALQPVLPMKRRLQVDVQADKARRQLSPVG